MTANVPLIEDCCLACGYAGECRCDRRCQECGRQLDYANPLRCQMCEIRMKTRESHRRKFVTQGN